MELIKKRYINWTATGRRLEKLRDDNTELNRYVCWYLKGRKGECGGVCETCDWEMDKHISRKELAEVFMVSEAVLFNWENGRCNVPLDELMFYTEICKVPLENIVVYEL